MALIDGGHRYFYTSAVRSVHHNCLSRVDGLGLSKKGFGPFGFCCSLSNPFSIIYLNRNLWSIIDLVTGLFLVVSVFVLQVCLASHRFGGKFSENPQSEPRPHSFPDPFCGRENSAEVLPNPFPQKISFGKTESALKPHALPEYLEGRTPEKKNTLSFFKKISPPPNQKCKECFFFRGLLAYSPVRGAFLERTGQFQATTHAGVRSHYLIVLEIGASLVQ